LKYVELVQKGTKKWPKAGSTTDATFTVKINGEAVATLDLSDVQASYDKSKASDISEISLDANEEATVVVEAKINADATDKDLVNTYILYLI
jgi:predicted flavoprotein YhiN